MIFARRANNPLRGQARAWSPYSTCCPQPGLGPQRFGLSGRGKRKRRRNASCMACGAKVSAADSHATACALPCERSKARESRQQHAVAIVKVSFFWFRVRVASNC